jgi:hypothetical protein
MLSISSPVYSATRLTRQSRVRWHPLPATPRAAERPELVWRSRDAFPWLQQNGNLVSDLSGKALERASVQRRCRTRPETNKAETDGEVALASANGRVDTLIGTRAARDEGNGSVHASIAPAATTSRSTGTTAAEQALEHAAVVEAPRVPQAAPAPCTRGHPVYARGRQDGLEHGSNTASTRPRTRPRTRLGKARTPKPAHTPRTGPD